MRILPSLLIHFLSRIRMFGRIFGKKKESVPAEVNAEQQSAQSEQNVKTATDAMMTIKKSANELEKK